MGYHNPSFYPFMVKSREDNYVDLCIVDSWVRRGSEAREEGPGAERVRSVLLGKRKRDANVDLPFDNCDRNGDVA